MSTSVCLVANTLNFPEGGGHFWMHLNWALGFRALGCSVMWLELVKGRRGVEALEERTEAVRARLEPYGLADRLALVSGVDEPLPATVTARYLGLDAAVHADLLVDFRYDVPPDVVTRFRRSALIDVDPGLLQIFIADGTLVIAPHDLYFTIGETVGTAGAVFPDAGLTWHYTPPAVSLESWTPVPAPAGAPYTSVSQWWGEWMKWGDDVYANDKRTAFLEFLSLPSHSAVSLELALHIGPWDDEERGQLERHGWRVRVAGDVSATPAAYRAYIARSRGEFSCAKPSCVRLQNAWISDRTLCYLASGKPAVVQHTGPSRFLPDADGLLRFRNVPEAARLLAEAERDYERHCRTARALAEEYFDARRAAAGLLERALA